MLKAWPLSEVHWMTLIMKVGKNALFSPLLNIIKKNIIHNNTALFLFVYLWHRFLYFGCFLSTKNKNNTTQYKWKKSTCLFNCVHFFISHFLIYIMYFFKKWTAKKCRCKQKKTTVALWMNIGGTEWCSWCFLFIVILLLMNE